jgi:small-conductance mechanosensitive channel
MWRCLLSNLIICFLYLLLAISSFIAERASAQLPTQDMVEQQIALLNPDSDEDAASLDKLQQIKEYLQEIVQWQQERAQLQTLLEQAPQRKVELYNKQQQAEKAQPVAVSEALIGSEIEQQLAIEKARHKEWSEQLGELEKEQQQLLEAQETLPTAIVEQEQIVDEQRKSDKIVEEGTDNKIERWLSLSWQTLQEEKLKVLILEQDTLVQRRELAKINAQILESQLALASEQIELFQVRLLEISTQSTQKVIEQAKQLSRTFADAPDYILQWNVKNEVLAAEFEALNRQLLLTQQKRQQLEVQRQQLMQNMAQIKGNIKWLNNSPAFSDAISVQLQLLPQLPDMGELANTVTAAHLQHFQLSTELAGLKDIPALINQQEAASELNVLYKRVLSSILNFRYELLSNTLATTDQFLAEITRLHALQEQFSVEIQEAHDFLREKRLFIRDRSALWELPSWQLNIWFDSNNLAQRIVRLLGNNAMYAGQLLLLAAFLLFVFVLLLQLTKADRRNRASYAAVVGKVGKDKFSHTLILLFSALGYGALVAVCLFAVQRWFELRLESFYSYDLDNIFTFFCLVLLVWESLIRMAMPDGLLQRHLGGASVGISWLQLMMSKQRWILYTLLAGILLCEIVAENSESLLLRFLYIVLLLWLIIFTYLLLRRNRLSSLLPKFVRSQMPWQLFRILFILPLIAITSLAVWGYFYTSWVVLVYYYALILCFLAAMLLRQLGVRWLKIEQRRIRQQRTFEKRAEHRHRDKSPYPGGTGEADLHVEEVSEQSLTVLNIVVIIFLFIMLSMLLSDSLLALQWLDEVIIWEVMTLTDSGQIVEAVSLKAVLSALIIFGLAFFLAKNIPGLLEILLLHRLHISTGMVYAAITLLRYAFVVCGFLIGVSILGFHWSRLQWLVAALGVGLGFGLQEIFANLVAGIILLFERPIRIGDTITVQGLSGTVMRIKTRATTILDWDKKEIVVPNKSLITEQLVNWSLSDAMIRIIIPVGVAYGSDVQLVKQLLIQAAYECGKVSREPEPQALFLQFGASSLDFELRVFLLQVEERSLVKDQLNTRIEQLLNQHQIEIPFPQMDIHLRDRSVED